MAQMSTYRLTCGVNSGVLDMPIELFFELDRPYTEAGSADVTFSASLTFEEQTTTDLIDAGVSTIDIVSIEIAAQVTGAAPGTIGTTLAAAPISNLDLEGDPDHNGIPGPHRFDLDTVIITTTVNGGMRKVEFGLFLGGISLVLGDLDVPEDCLGTSLVGFSASFPVE
jgi:hypothetical protein